MLDPGAGGGVRGEPDTILSRIALGTFLTILTILTILSVGNLVLFAIGGGELPSTRLSCKSGDTSNHESGVDLVLQFLDSALQSTNVTVSVRKVGLQFVDVIIVVRTRYGYPCETQYKSPCKEQIFEFFVHSTKTKLNKVLKT